MKYTSIPTLFVTFSLFFLSSTEVYGQTLMHVDFNSFTPGLVIESEIQSAFNTISFEGRDAEEDGLQIIPDPLNTGKGQVLRVKYEAGEYGRNGSSGGQWKSNIERHDELYLYYDVLFHEMPGGGFEYVKGGKLPRLQSYDWDANAGMPADGTDRWTGGMMWKADGLMTTYVYHAEMPGLYGHSRPWTDENGQDIHMTSGVWHSIENRIKINTPGVLDGEYQIWYDGKLVSDEGNRFMFRMPGGERLDIGEFLFTTFFGGSNSSFAPDTDNMFLLTTSSFPRNLLMPQTLAEPPHHRQPNRVSATSSPAVPAPRAMVSPTPSTVTKASSSRHTAEMSG